MITLKRILFDSLSITDGEMVTADFDVSLSETEAAFLFVEVTEDMEGTMRYTYSTQDSEGVSCKMQFELVGLDKDKVTYVSAFSREQALDRISEKK